MNERRRGEDMRTRRDQEFEGGRDMGRGNRGSQWRDQGDGDFAASRRGDDWEREAGFNGQSDNRYDEGADRDRYGDDGQGRQGSRGYESGSMRGGSRQSMSGGYGTSNEGYGGNRGMSGSWGSQGWSGESSGSGSAWGEGRSGGMQRFAGNGGQQGGWEYRNRQGNGGDQGYSGSQSFGWGSSQGYGGSQGQGRMDQSRYSGMGPKGYRRSDDRIREDVSDRLTDDGSIDASEIEVDVKGGEVTLSGTVADREQKRRAEDIAESCSGVTNVTNNIRCQDRMRGSNGSGNSTHGQSASGQAGSSPSTQGQSGSGQQSQAGKKST